MNCKCKVDQRRLTPGVFYLKQFLNGSETMVWELDNCVINQGTCDLKQYDAFLTLSVAGEIDEIMLTKQQKDDTLQLIWNVGTYATALKGYVKYQVCFRNAFLSTLGVISGDPEANGVYNIVSRLTEGIYREFRNPKSGFTIKWDAEKGRWTLYRADGVTVVDYQTTPSTEPYRGAWRSVAVGNNEAAAWISDEAIMYVSDSIAADQAITGNFPTILRQVWHRVHDMIVKSGVTVFEGEVTADSWKGSAAPYYTDATALVSIPNGCTIEGIRLMKAAEGGAYSNIANIRYEQDASGTVKVYCLEKITGKLAVTIKGGNGYAFISEETIAGEMAAAVSELEGI